MEMQQALLGTKSAVIVSPAPMFSVKLIESIQKLFTLAGKPLVVDAENWMAMRPTCCCISGGNKTPVTT